MRRNRNSLLLSLTVCAATAATARVPVVHEHCIAVPHGQLLLLATGLPENGVVREYHDRARNPERNRTGDDHVDFVNYELARVRIRHGRDPVLVRRIPSCGRRADNQQLEMRES